MSKKLFPPYIEGILPAFTFSDNTISIPFSHNPTVNEADVLGYSLQIKSISTGDILLVLTRIGYTVGNIVTFQATNEEINNVKESYQGNYLKFQLAYIQRDTDAEKKLIDIQDRIFKVKNALNYPNEIDLNINMLQLVEQLFKINSIWKYLNRYYQSIKNTLSQTLQDEIWDDLVYITQANNELIAQYNTNNYNLDLLTGHYSTVGVAKWCFPTEISLSKTSDLDNNNLIQNQLLSRKTNFINGNTVYGIYSSPNDSSEKVYSYVFNIYDQDKNLLETSGEQLHNNSNNTTSSSYDKFRFNTSLQQGQNYLFEYAITTTNKLQQSVIYTIKQQPTVKIGLTTNLIAEANSDNGYIQLSLDFTKRLTFGHYILYRTDETSNFKNWTQILAFDLSHKKGKINIWKDLSIEQGVLYQYAIEQYNQYDIHSQKILSNKVKAKFEDLFLFDGERQLNIKFNPKVSTFKDTILEQKIETIGSQFPFVFRNGKVKYKEFAISGLISYNMDNEELFIKGTDLGILEDTYQRNGTPYSGIAETHNLGRNTNVSELNITVERKFKLAVLEWLNNGKIKCLKSPTEGNYLVRLINVSLSPEDSLGRMLHSFSATAYEMKECTMQNIVDLWYYDAIQNNLNSYKNSEYTETTIQIREVLETAGNNTWISIYPNKERIKNGVSSIWFQNVTPGTEFIITYKDQFANTTITSTSSSNFIMNNTGYLSFDNLPEGHTISDLQIKNKVLQDQEVGQITFGYYTTINTAFDHILNITNKDIVGQQYLYDDCKGENIIKIWNNNLKSTITKFYALQFNKIDYNFNHVFDLIKNLKAGDKITTAHYNLIKLYLSELTNNTNYFESFNSKYYQVVYNNFNKIFNFENTWTTEEGLTINWKEKDKLINWFIISEYKNPTDQQKQKIYLDKKNSLLYLDNIENIKYIELGPNVSADLSYEYLQYLYDIENDLKSELFKILKSNSESSVFYGSAQNRELITNYANKYNREIVRYYWEQEWVSRSLARLTSSSESATETTMNIISGYRNWYKYYYWEYVKELKKALLDLTKADAQAYYYMPEGGILG